MDHSPASPSPSHTPTVLAGKYRLGRLLGRGGFGKVYQAFSTEDESHVAIKIIDKSVLEDPSMSPKQIVAEVSAMRRLNHPNIINIHEVLATKSKIYLVMELAAGGDLEGKLHRRPNHRIPERMACRYFHQIVSALNFCHRHGIVHRDIKPGNILLDRNGNVKVSDFGLSGFAKGDSLLLKTGCGTRGYTAPEVRAAVMRGGVYDGAKADAWSCGVMLYTLVVGAMPFYDENKAIMHLKACRREFGFPSHVSKRARGVIYKLLDPDPKTRMSMEEIMENPWFNSIEFGPKSVSLGDLVSLNEIKLEKSTMGVERVSSMNAFDIIGMNSALDLSGILDDGIGMKKRCFTTKSGVEEVEERMVEAGIELGYEVEKGKGGKIWLGMEKLLLVAEISQLGPELLVEIRVVQGGGCAPCGGSGGGGSCGGYGGGIGESKWEEIKAALGDVVASWHIL